MGFRTWVFHQLKSRIADKRKPREIGKEGDTYLRRWHVIPRNKWFNIYLHEFLRSDDDRALHDHPWVNFSWVLQGNYNEHTISAGGINHRTLRREGDFAFRWPWSAHRVELLPRTIPVTSLGSVISESTVGLERCWTLFITGPSVREWGFHCPLKGWVHHKRFGDPMNPDLLGPGCGD